MDASAKGPPSGGQGRRGSPGKKRSGPRKTTRFAEPVSDDTSNSDGGGVEITLDVRDDSVIQSVRPILKPEERPSSSSSRKSTRVLVVRSDDGGFREITLSEASSRIKQVSEELRRIASLNRGRRFRDRSKTKISALQALTELRFVSGAHGVAEWSDVEYLFKKITKNQGGVLRRDQFGQCIGRTNLS
jgi:respiratory burst oxidase